MLRTDQFVRSSQWKRLRNLEKQKVDHASEYYKKEKRKLVDELTKVDKQNTAKIKKIIARYGWPGENLVGKKGSRSAWLIVQHATHNLKFQKRCLKLLKVAVEKGEADKKYLAYLTDRTLVQENKKQIYGTQFKGKSDGKSEPFPIKDLRKLMILRREAGLESFSKYKKRMRMLNLR